MRRPRRSASSGSWVTSRTVRPASSRAARSCALWRVMASRLPNGSSHQHHRPVLHERADQRDTLALPPGKRRRAGGEELRQADLPQQQPRPVEVRPLAPQPRAKDRIVEDARPGKQQVVPGSYRPQAPPAPGLRPRRPALRSVAAGWTCRRRWAPAGRSRRPLRDGYPARRTAEPRRRRGRPREYRRQTRFSMRPRPHAPSAGANRIRFLGSSRTRDLSAARRRLPRVERPAWTALPALARPCAAPPLPRPPKARRRRATG